MQQPNLKKSNILMMGHPLIVRMRRMKEKMMGKKRIQKTWMEAYEINLTALEQKETRVDLDVPISPLWVSPWHRAMCERW